MKKNTVFTEIENLTEIKKLLPQEIESVQGLNITPLKIEIYGKIKGGFDFNFEINNRMPVPPAPSSAPF